MAKNGKQVKDALSREAVLVNGRPVGSDMNMQLESVFSLDEAKYERFFIVKLGKKQYHLYSL